MNLFGHLVGLLGRGIIQYIRRSSPHLESLASFRNLRTRHAVVNRGPN